VENITRAGGLLYLAKTNALTLTTAGYVNTDGSGSPYGGNPALYLGHNKTAFGNGAQLYLGINNSLALDYVTVGRGDANDLLAFNPAFLGFNPSVTIQGLGGTSSRVGVYVVGDGSPGQGASSVATNDFTGGTVNALVNYLCVGRGRQGANDTTTCSGLLTFDNGSINANTLTMGFLYPSGSNSVATGTVNVNGGTLTVISNLVLATRPNVGGVGSAQATLNLNGGTVQATNILGGGGLSTVNLNSGRLDLQSGNPAPGQIANISTLNVGAAPVSAPAVLANAAAISVSNTIVIAPNGTLAGNTLITAPGLTVNGTLSPGAIGAGWITNNGPLTLGAGGTYVVTVQDALAGPVAGWSFVKTSAGMDIRSASGAPFTVALQTPGLAANFDYHTNYDWVIAAANSGITNFDPAKFAVNDSLFANDLAGGCFFVRSNNSSLVLSFINNHPPVAAIASFYRTGTVMMIPLASLAPYWSDPDGDPVTLAGVNSSSASGTNNVVADSLYIYYTNANNVADDILYTVRDVRTNPPAVYRPGDTVQTALGVINIVPPPAISGSLLGPTNLVLSGGGGIPNQTYYVLTSTNLALPLADWTVMASNSFDTGGNFQFTDGITPGTPHMFYVLRLAP
jgi:hypothetical protein